MPNVALLEAKNRLSALIDRVLAGEEFGITRRGKVVARLAPPEGDDAAARARRRCQSARQPQGRQPGPPEMHIVGYLAVKAA